MNWKVFPAYYNHEGQKVPLLKGVNWRTAASNDPEQIRLWQEIYRDRIKFWGVPCSENGIFVLDVDAKKPTNDACGWDSLKELGIITPNTLIQETPSGGHHIIFKAPEGVHCPTTVNKKLGLDTRGDGGWMAYYGKIINPQAPLMEAPEWLFKLVNKSMKPKSEQTGTPVAMLPEIANAIMLQCIENIRIAPQGESNNVLNIEAYKVGQLVAAGSVSREYAEEALYKAAIDRGKPPYEAKATINSGLGGGLKNPITAPFPASAPIAKISIPAPPEPEGRWTPNYLTVNDLLNTNKLRKPQLFQDWSTEDIHIVTGDGGTGKTTLQLYEAICLALGDRFLGFNCKQRGKTLYITGEDTEAKLAAMIGQIMRQMGLVDNNGPTSGNAEKVQMILESIVIKKDSDMTIITQDKQGFLHPNLVAYEKVAQAIEDIKPSMVIIDPISAFWGSEAKLNDMNKAVNKWNGKIVETFKVCLVMINHMGKSSSSNKDMSQFAGRGGSGLPSNARVSRVLRSLSPEEYTEMTGNTLEGDKSAMLCNVNKFSDGSPLFNKPFIIIRDKFLFARENLTTGKIKEMEKQMSDIERIFTYVKTERVSGRYPTRKVVIGFFATQNDKISKERCDQALNMITYAGHIGDKFREIDNPDLSIGGKVLTIVDSNGEEYQYER